MSATSETEFLHLSQYTQQDSFNILQDYNGDMQKIDNFAKNIGNTGGNDGNTSNIIFYGRVTANNLQECEILLPDNINLNYKVAINAYVRSPYTTYRTSEQLIYSSINKNYNLDTLKYSTSIQQANCTFGLFPEDGGTANRVILHDITSYVGFTYKYDGRNNSITFNGLLGRLHDYQIVFANGTLQEFSDNISDNSNYKYPTYLFEIIVYI